jgi:hypothetical protein
MVRGLFQDPHAFFDRKTSARGIRWEFVLLLVVGALGAAGWGWLSLTFLDALAGDRDQFRILMLGKSLQVLLVPLALWVYYSVTLHLVASLYQTRGSFGPMLKMVAWALVPVAVTGVARSVALYLAFSDETLPSDPEGLSPEAVFASLWETAAGDLPLVAFYVVSILVVLAVGHLLRIGIQHVRDVSADRAVRIVAFPVALHVLYLVWRTLSVARVI